MKHLTILGATGSIGMRTLELVSSFPEEFAVAGLAARGSNVEVIADLCRKYAPKAVALLDDDAIDRLAELLPAPRPELLRGPGGLAALAGEVEADIVVSALVGAAGLLPTMAASPCCPWIPSIVRCSSVCRATTGTTSTVFS